MEELKAKRSSCKGEITRIETFMKDANLENVTEEQLHERAERLKELFNEFNCLQCEIELGLKTEAETEAEFSYRSLVEERYFNANSIASFFKKELRKLNSPPEPVPPPSPSLFSNNEITNALQSLIDHQSMLSMVVEQLSKGNVVPGNKDTRNLHPEIKLQPIAIPSFRGNYKDWPSFHDLFKSLVHDNKNLSPSQKFQYLKNALAGEAASLLRHLTISDANYKEPYEQLLDTYDKSDFIIDAHLQTIMEQQKCTQASSEGLRLLSNNIMESVRALKALGLPTDHWDQWLIYVTVTKLDKESSQLWRREQGKRSKDQSSKFSDLTTFINNRIYELTNLQEQNKDDRYRPKAINTQKSKLSYAISVVSCIRCQANHFIYECPQFKALSVKSKREYALERGLCFNCLKGRHLVKNCMSRSSCQTCYKRHHSTLHDSENVSTGTPSSQAIRNSSSTPCINQVQSNVAVQTKILSANILPTALILVNDSSNEYQLCRALLDSGSQITLISESCAQRLKLKRINLRVPVHGVCSSEPNFSKGKVISNIKSRLNDFHTSTEALILRNLTSEIPSAKVAISCREHFQTLELADPSFWHPSNVDILLGCDIFFMALKSGKLDNPVYPVAQETAFGWVISGRSSPKSFQYLTSLHTCIDIDASLQKFWELENLNIDIPYHTNEEKLAEEHFVKFHTRLDDGRYMVRLPFKEDSVELGNSRKAAMSRFKWMESKFDKDDDFRIQYTAFMDEYLTLGHMKSLPVDNPQLQDCKAFYLPHHGVTKQSSTTTRLRVVFDASRPTTSGISLNNSLMVGPKLQSDIWTQLLKFPSDRASDRAFQRILWRDRKTGLIKEYELLTVTYGTSCAPHLAVRTLHQLAIDEYQRHTKGAQNFLNNFYVDDFMGGSNTLDEALEIKKDLMSLLAKGGFDFRKWSSNCSKFIDTVDSDHRASSFSIPTESDMPISTLGLIWNTSTDTFGIQCNLGAMVDITKRNILSEISKIYDPFGWLAPCIITAKILMQRLWISGVDWDQVVPTNLCKQWLEFRPYLGELKHLNIPRWFNIEATSKVLLIGFCDASELAYAAVVYLRVETNGIVNIQLIGSKTKVAPIRQVSLPRLELCGAHLLSKLMSKIAVDLNVSVDNSLAFTDSTIVLAWLKEIPRKWNPFIANRTSDILNIRVLPYKHWRHVSTNYNPADCASRGISALDLLRHEMWWKGPAFIYENRSDLFTKIDDDENKTELEQRISSLHIHEASIIEEHPILDRFSTLNQVVRIFAWCLRFWSNLNHSSKGESINLHETLKANELDLAMESLVRFAQQTEFVKKVNALQNGECVESKSKIVSLDPFVDKAGVIRVGGRLNHANILYDKKHPRIIPKNHKLAHLIITDLHLRYFHAGQQLVLNVLHLKYWIIGCKNLVRSIIRKCVVCIRYRAQGCEQLMGNILNYRLQPARPFTNTGVDFAGPFSVKPWKGRGTKQFKCYISLFICMTTRAVHIELVTDLSTENFMAALNRFMSRRGACQNIFSDNGKNFVGAARKINEAQLFLQKSNTEIERNLSDKGISWHFIPAYSPHFGGIWESAVKMTKFHMKRVIGDSILTYQELETFLCQVEACLNSRPIAPKTADKDDLEALAPGHFLTQGPITLPQDEKLSERTTTYSTRWQFVNSLHKHFWKRWHLEYISNLQNRRKWKQIQENLKPDDLVVVMEDNVPPCKWLLGRVTNTHCGTDRLVRVVSLRTKGGIIKRPITKLCLLLAK